MDSSKMNKTHTHSHSHSHSSKHHHHKEHSNKKKKEMKKLHSKENQSETTHKSHSFTKFSILTKDDYYCKNTEFRVWLNDYKGIIFEDLNRKKSLDYFEKFIKLWNKKKLDNKYYQGISSFSLNVPKRTRHVWSFTNQINNDEKNQLSTLQTDANIKSQHFNDSEFKILRTNAISIGPRLQLQSQADKIYENEMKNEADKKLRKQDIKQWEKQKKTVMEELHPKPDSCSFADRINKKREKGKYCHPRDQSPDRNDDELLGEVDDYQKALKRKHQRIEKKNHVKQERLQELEEKELERMRKFAQSMGFTLDNRFQH